MGEFSAFWTYSITSNRLKASVGLSMNANLGGIGQNLLIDNFDSTKGEIRCYSNRGYRLPFSGNLFLG